MIKFEIDFARCPIGTIPCGTGNDFSRVSIYLLLIVYYLLFLRFLDGEVNNNHKIRKIKFIFVGEPEMNLVNNYFNYLKKLVI